MSYASFDEMANLISVQLDPIQFLELLKKPLVLDEIQRAPEIFLPIKVDIDQNRKAGRYLLTGSANPLLVPKIDKACFNRKNGYFDDVAIVSGRNFREEREVFRLSFFRCGLVVPLRGMSTRGTNSEILSWGISSLQKGNERQRKEWCNQYLFLMLQKDINDLSKIEGFSHLPALVYGLAASWSTLNIEELSRITKTASTSVRRYMQLLESLFLLYRLGSWSLNVDKQLTKSPKLYFSDTALMLFILNMDEDLLRKDPQTLGYVLENFVVMECVKQCSWSSLFSQIIPL